MIQAHPIQRTHTLGGSITVHVVSNLNGLDLTEQENVLLFVWTGHYCFQTIKQETRQTVILPPKVSVLCPIYPNSTENIHQTLTVALGTRKSNYTPSLFSLGI